MNKIEQAYLDGFIKSANGFGFGDLLGGAEKMVKSTDEPDLLRNITPSGNLPNPAAGLLSANYSEQQAGADRNAAELAKRMKDNPERGLVPLSAPPEQGLVPYGAPDPKPYGAPDPNSAGKFHLPNFIKSLREKINNNPKTSAGLAIGTAAPLLGYEGKQTADTTSAIMQSMKTPHITSAQATQLYHNQPVDDGIHALYNNLMQSLKKHPGAWAGGAAGVAGLGGLGYYMHGHKGKEDHKPNLDNEPGGPEDLE